MRSASRRGSTASNLRPSWSPDGKRIAFQSNREGPYHIYVMDSDGGNVNQLTNGDSDERHPAWSPDGKYLAVDSGDAPARLTKDLASEANSQCTFACHSPAWSPDSNRMALSDGDSSRVVIISALGGAQTPISPADE